MNKKHRDQEMLLKKREKYAHLLRSEKTEIGPFVFLIKTHPPTFQALSHSLEFLFSVCKAYSVQVEDI